jgi:ubiquinone/menaquinone biosynthesis C-methylase UbiE
MLAEARRHAASAGLRAVAFVQASVEDLPRLTPPLVRVATFGQSFHRTDRLRAAEAVHHALEPGGSMVLIVHDATRPPPKQLPGIPPVPHAAVEESDHLRAGSTRPGPRRRGSHRRLSLHVLRRTALFGARLADFVADLRPLLEQRSPTGRFWDWPGDTEILIATRR